MWLWSLCSGIAGASASPQGAAPPVGPAPEEIQIEVQWLDVSDAPGPTWPGLEVVLERLGRSGVVQHDAAALGLRAGEGRTVPARRRRPLSVELLTVEPRRAQLELRLGPERLRTSGWFPRDGTPLAVVVDPDHLVVVRAW